MNTNLSKLHRLFPDFMNTTTTGPHRVPYPPPSLLHTTPKPPTESPATLFTMSSLVSPAVGEGWVEDREVKKDLNKEKGDVRLEDDGILGEKTIGEGPREEEDVRIDAEPPRREDEPRQFQTESPPYDPIQPDPEEGPTHQAHYFPEEEYHPMDVDPDTRLATHSPPQPSSPLSAPPASL
ncbi:hypothetical protein DXG01_003680 [Tephrocybe rancida]|nr:hypothetical protein DXG01_003680 [Tephrocybe rancida]